MGVNIKEYYEKSIMKKKMKEKRDKKKHTVRI